MVATDGQPFGQPFCSTCVLAPTEHRGSVSIEFMTKFTTILPMALATAVLVSEPFWPHRYAADRYAPWSPYLIAAPETAEHHPWHDPVSDPFALPMFGTTTAPASGSVPYRLR